MLADGFVSTPDPDRGLQVMTSIWTWTGTTNGVYHIEGSPKLTWQVIAEQNLASYDIMANPIYTPILMALADAKNKVRSIALGAN